MEIIEKPNYKKKIFISTVGWVSAIFAGLLIYFSLTNLLNLYIFKQSLLFELQTDEHGFSLEKILSIAYSIFFASHSIIVVFGFVFLISSIGLIKYKNWGRRLYIISSWVLIVICITIIISYIANASNILEANFSFESPKSRFHHFPILESIDNIARLSLGIKIASYGILVIILLRTLFRIILRFNKKEYKQVFN